MANLAARLRYLRNSRGLTQDDLAARAQMARQTVTKIERGGFASLDILRALAAALDLDDTAYCSLLVDWIHTAIGPEDASRLNISTSYILRDEPLTELQQLKRRLDNLPADQIRLLLRALDEPRLMPILESILRLRGTAP